jgi:hypothetical protein
MFYGAYTRIVRGEDICVSFKRGKKERQNKGWMAQHQQEQELIENRTQKHWLRTTTKQHQRPVIHWRVQDHRIFLST